MSTIRTLLDICLLRGKPQDLPVSPLLVWQTALLSVLSNFVMDNLHPNMAMRLLFAATQAGLLGGVVWGALKIRGFPERWMQTISPLYAAGTLMNVIAWPVFTFIIPPDTTAGNHWALMFGIGMTVWFVAIMSHVIHHALELSMGRSVAVTLACLLISGIALVLLLPIPGMP